VSETIATTITKKQVESTLQSCWVVYTFKRLYQTS